MNVNKGKVTKVGQSGKAPRSDAAAQAIGTLAGKINKILQDSSNRGTSARTDNSSGGKANETGAKRSQRSQSRRGTRFAVGKPQGVRLNSDRMGPNGGDDVDEYTVGIAHGSILKSDMPEKEVRFRSSSWPGHTGIEFSGTELLTTATVCSGANFTPEGVFELNPLCFQGLRLAVEAKNWQYFRFREVSLEYIPSVPTTQAGQLFLTYCPDPDQNIFLKTGIAGLRKVEALENSINFSVWMNAVMKVLWKEDSEWMRTQMAGEQRLQSQGVLAYGSTVTTGLGSGASPVGVGLLRLHYAVEFASQIIDDTAQQPDTASVTFTPAANAGNAQLVVAATTSTISGTFPAARVFRAIVSSGGSTLLRLVDQTALQANFNSSFYYLTPGASLYFTLGTSSNTLTFYSTAPSSLNQGDPVFQVDAGTIPPFVAKVFPVVVENE